MIVVSADNGEHRLTYVYVPVTLVNGQCGKQSIPPERPSGQCRHGVNLRVVAPLPVRTELTPNVLAKPTVKTEITPGGIAFVPLRCFHGTATDGT